MVQSQQPAAKLSTAAGDVPQPTGKSSKHRVLIVDDEALVRWSIAETLDGGRYEVLEAGDAESARALLELSPLDLVLLDLRLPDCSDLSLLTTIRRVAPQAAVILMTAFGTPEVRDRARGLGALSVIDKPFDMRDLARLVAQACQIQ